MSALRRQAAISLQIARQARTSPNAQRRPAMKLVCLRLSSELLSSNHPVHLFRQMQFSKTSYPKPRCCHTLKFRVIYETAGQTHQSNIVGWDISTSKNREIRCSWTDTSKSRTEMPCTHRRLLACYSTVPPIHSQGH